MDFFRDIVDTFIPHEENGYKPHFFRARAVLFVAACVLVLAGGVFVLQTIMIRNHASLAAVISAVLVNLTNTDRTDNNLGTLAVSPTLQAAAQLKANDMAAKGYFAHTSPDGLTPWHWFAAAGYQYQYAGENLAVRFSDSIDVENAWMNSPDHRANILNSHFTEIGIATAEGTYEGQPAIFVVQLFGTPAPTAAAPSAATALGVGTTTSASDAPVATNTQSAVAGTSTENAAPEVMMQDDTFIAVRNPAVASSSLATTAPARTSTFMLLLTSPETVGTYALLFIGALVIIALILMVVIEIRHQHPRSVLLGVLLLALIVVLLWVWQLYFPGQLVIR